MAPKTNETKSQPPLKTHEKNGVNASAVARLPTAPAPLPDETLPPKKSEAEDKVAKLTPAVIVQIALDADTEVFRDQHGDVFVWIPTVGDNVHYECLKLKSMAARARLLELIRHKATTPPQPTQIRGAVEILELEAYHSPRADLANRRTMVGDRIAIDMGDSQWRMILVGPDGWTTSQQDKPRFYRAQHQQALPEPVSGGELREIFQYVAAESPDEELLVLTWLIAALDPGVSNPILVLLGQHGAKKTTTTRRFRSLVDPSVTPVLGEIEKSNLFLTFQHHALPCFDNVGRFNSKESDMFCRAVTGNGVERRKLYTDSDQALYSFRRPIIINGINLPTTRPDFLDRCLVINCRRRDKFRNLKELDREFEAARPRLLGAMLDVLVKVLRDRGEVGEESEFRMADFAQFGRSVARALGKAAEDFDAAYRRNLEQRNYDILEDAPVTRLILAFAANHTSAVPWVGSAEALLDELSGMAVKKGLADAKRDLPRSARWLSSRLAELSPALAVEGVIARRRPRTNASRPWEISITDDPAASSKDVTPRAAD